MGLPKDVQERGIIKGVIIHGDDDIFRVFPEGVEVFLVRLQIPVNPAEQEPVRRGSLAEFLRQICLPAGELVCRQVKDDLICGPCLGKQPLQHLRDTGDPGRERGQGDNQAAG